MKPKRWGLAALALAAVCALAVLGAPTLAHETEKDKNKAAPGQADMEAWMNMNKPGPQHEVLKSMSGSWKTSMKMWMDPSQPPQVVEGTSTKTMILDGRYLQEEAKGTMMGQPFHGVGVIGYDNVKKEFVSTWVDNMTTGIMMSTGTYDTAAKAFTMHSEMFDPMAGGNTKVRMVTRLTGNGSHVFEWYANGPGGKEMKAMEITYTRI